MDLGLRERVVVVAAAQAADRQACLAVLETEGCRVVTVDRLEAAADAVDRAVREHGRVDGVVMVLPEHAPRRAQGLDLAALQDGWSAVEAVVAAFRAAVPAMQQRGWGRLVSVASRGVKWLADDVDAADTLAGLGVLGVHKSVVADVARHGISANAVLRGPEASAQEVADAVVFLLSDGAGYMQGITLALDGALNPAMF